MTTLTIFRATGDLATQLLFPVRARIEAGGVLDDLRILDPTLDVWHRGEPMAYPAGADRPSAQDDIILTGHHWRPIGPDPRRNTP